MPVRELKAIVFPELIRYNRIFDAIQIESLKFLYVSEGKSYADFSVGYFQMKPSFAEMVEADATKAMLEKAGAVAWAVLPDKEESRRARVQRITSIDQQMIYLCLFYQICRERFSARHFSSGLDRVRFFATCYNAGYRQNEAGILNFQKRNQFYKYNYAAVSAYYFGKE